MSAARWWIAAVVLELVACKAHGSSSGSAAHSDAAGPQEAPSAESPIPSTSNVTAWLGSSVAVPDVPPPTSTGYAMFRKTTLSIDELTKLVTAAPQLARVGRELSFFDPSDGSYIVRSTADREGVVFTTQPLLWSPSQGRQALVVAAHGKNASFVAAWWVLPDGGYRLASSLVMMGEVAPVALAWKPAEGRTLWWTSCWQCPGETGRVSVREDGHLVVVQD